MQLYRPFDTLLASNPDFNQSDVNQEIELLFQRQKMIEGFVDGSVSANDLLEFMADQLIEVDQYVEEVEENVSLILNHA